MSFIEELYDGVADKYDGLYTDPICAQENKNIACRLRYLLDKWTVLDVWCGTGLLLDILPEISYENYVWVDISRKMLEIAHEKHNGYVFRHEDFLEFDPKERNGEAVKYRVIVSLFSALNYIGLENWIEKIKTLLQEWGYFYVMIYWDGRGHPDYYNEETEKHMFEYDRKIAHYCKKNAVNLYTMDSSSEGVDVKALVENCEHIEDQAEPCKYYILTNYPLRLPLEMRDFIEENKRVEAKTFKDTAPHEYVVRGECLNEQSFLNFAQYIRDYWATEYFRKKPYKYMYIGGYKYWTMWAPLEITTIINRAKP